MSTYALTLPRTLLPSRDLPEVASYSVPNEETALFERFLAGDDGAFVELFDRHNHRLFVYCLKIVGSAEQAEDITQELWERIIKLRQKPQAVGNPVGLFVTISRNLCINHMKMRQRRTALNATIDMGDRYHVIREKSELEELVPQALEKLSFDFREVLVLNVYCEYEYEEIARMLGKTVEAIRMRASRARAQLRTILLEMAKNLENATAMHEKFLATAERPEDRA